MAPEIKVVFLDVGNTLRLVEKDAEFQARARQEMVELVGVDADPMEFCANARRAVFCPKKTCQRAVD